MSLSLNEEGRNMIKLIEWCGQSNKLRIVCMDEGWDRILQEDGLDVSVQRVRACLEFDYIRLNIYLNNKQRKVIRGFLEELDTKDPKLMYEALMISAQGIDGLREAYDYLSNVGLISMPFERYQELSMPLVKIIYYMLGPTLEREDPKDELTYHESVRTSIRNAIIVSEWGSILSDMRDSFIADIARPHMEDTGCMIRSILISWEKKNRRQYSICSSEIIDLIMLLQEMGVDRDQQYVEWTMSVIKSEKNPTERYLQLKKMGLIPEGLEEGRFTELSNPLHALFRRRK